jgi:hypothetical protein
LPGTELAQAERAQDELSATSEPANIDELADIKDIAAGSRYFCESLFWASQPKQAAKT